MVTTREIETSEPVHVYPNRDSLSSSPLLLRSTKVSSSYPNEDFLITLCEDSSIFTSSSRTHTAAPLPPLHSGSPRPVDSESGTYGSSLCTQTNAIPLQSPCSLDPLLPASSAFVAGALGPFCPSVFSPVCSVRFAPRSETASYTVAMGSSPLHGPLPALPLPHRLLMHPLTGIPSLRIAPPPGMVRSPRPFQSLWS